jgi:hypothetical protein
MQDKVGEEIEVLVPGVQIPTAQPFLENWFHNQQENLNNDGYDSEGHLPHFADKEGPISLPPLLPNTSQSKFAEGIWHAATKEH